MNRTATIAVLAACVFGIAVPAAAHAEAIVNTGVVSYHMVSQGVPLCGGEDVTFSGDVFVLSHTTLNEAGGYENAFHLNFKNMTAIGVTSGSTYHMPDTENFETILNGTQSTMTVVVNGHLVGSGPNENGGVQILTKVTVDTNGTVTASFDRFTVTCL